MLTTVDLAEAATALRAHFGPRFASSRLGGQQRLAAVLRDRFALDATDAERILAALARRQAISWEIAPGLARPCPGVVELCGDWLIQPGHVPVGEQVSGRGHAYMAYGCAG
jgi:hypothetical protein